jgi:tetratricopeptide (TPR) repeat protein
MWNYGRKGGAMRSSGASLAVVATLAIGSVSLAGCSKWGEVKAMRAFKEGNTAYQQQDYQKAAQFYESAVGANPNLNQVYFYLGNSYDNMYKPSRKGEADNDALLTKAVQDYQESANRLSKSDDPADKNLAQLSLDYLVAAYGPDKLNDAAKAEPVVQEMIRLDPSNVDNYFKLSKIYEDAGVYDWAEKMLLYAKDAKPSDPNVYLQLARYYNTMGDFPKTIAALRGRAEQEPNNPEAYFVIATYYWDNAQKNFSLTPEEKADNIHQGLDAIDKALELKSDYTDAMVYKGLLLRLQANIEKDPKVQQSLIKQAEQLHDKAEEMRKAQTAGA